ncbi:MAG: hypothetical protein ACPG1A_14440, partial [Halioglobus sp.]
MTVRITHKNSEAVDKRPTASQLAKGEIAVNLNAEGAFLTVKDTAGNVQQVGGVKVSSNSPANPVLGTLWVDSDDNRLYVYDGATWRSVSGAGGGGGGGSITLVDGNGIDINQAGTTFTISVDLMPNANRTGGNGLEFDGNDKLRGRVASATDLGVVRVGSNLEIDADGVLSIDGAITGGLTYKGNLDIVGADADEEPTTRAAGDTYTSVESGAITTAGTSSVNWQDLLGDTGNTTVGDLIVCKDAAGGTGNWVIVRTGGQELWENTSGNDLEPKNNAHIIKADTLTANVTTGTGIVMATGTGQLVRAQPKGGIEIDGGQIQIDADALPLPGQPGAPNGDGNFGFWNRDNTNANLSPRATGD